MRTDRTSLVDLGLLPDTSGTWPLATWLDHTHAAAGLEALKRLIAEPLESLDAILARQRLLPQLASMTTQVPWANLYVLATQVERFLASNYVVVPSARARRLLFMARYREIATHVAAQLRAVEALLALCESLHARLLSLPDDAATLAMASTFDAAVRHAQRERLRAAVDRGSEEALVAVDAAVRGDMPSDRSTERRSEVHAPMRSALEALIGAIPRLDALCSLATASANASGTVPRMLPPTGGSLSFDDLRHPLLPRGVGNDVHLADGDRVLFLTGPNMAGKSTVLRAMGIAVHCAHLGMTVAARRADVPVYDQLLASITVRDNLARGESLYLSEIRRVRLIVDAVDRGDAVLALFDEVFRGTNIMDATDATALLVDGLSRAVHGTFFIASHLAEVARARAHARGVTCWCMGIDMSSNSPQFTYRMERGISEVHLGMILLDAEGVGPILRRLAAH